ncbi:MAG: hypothetical protein P8L77_04625 [Gammaproteobacteria bacterium]|nr:hypothetical protein [Gammaproteobacteria bacterium]
MKYKYILSTIFLASIASADIGTTKMWQLDSKASKYPYINIANKASNALEKGNDDTREGLEKLGNDTGKAFKKK